MFLEKSAPSFQSSKGAHVNRPPPSVACRDAAAQLTPTSHTARANAHRDADAASQAFLKAESSDTVTKAKVEKARKTWEAKSRIRDDAQKKLQVVLDQVRASPTCVFTQPTHELNATPKSCTRVCLRATLLDLPSYLSICSVLLLTSFGANET